MNARSGPDLPRPHCKLGGNEEMSMSRGMPRFVPRDTRGGAMTPYACTVRMCVLWVEKGGEGPLFFTYCSSFMRP